MATLRDQLHNLTRLKHRLAVWEALHAYLDENFVAKDGRPAQKSLKVPDCLVDVVSEDEIEDVMKALAEGPVTDLRAEISAIENQEVTILPGGASGKEAAS